MSHGPKMNSKPPNPCVAHDLERLVGYNLRRAYLVIEAHFRATLGADNMAHRTYGALSLEVQSPITQSEMARVLGIERSGLVAITDELEARGYLKRVPVPGDRRVQALVPTEAGDAAYHSTLALVENHEAEVTGALTPEEHQTLIVLLQKIRRSNP